MIGNLRIAMKKRILQKLREQDAANEEVVPSTRRSENESPLEKPKEDKPTKGRAGNDSELTNKLTKKQTRVDGGDNEGNSKKDQGA